MDVASPAQRLGVAKGLYDEPDNIDAIIYSD